MNEGKEGLVVNTVDQEGVRIISGGCLLGVEDGTIMSHEDFDKAMPAGVTCSWNPQLN